MTEQPANEGAGAPGLIPIAFILTDLTYGGVQLNALRLIHHLDRTRFRPLVIAVYAGGPVQALLERMQVPVHVFDCVARIPGLPFLKWPKLSVLRRIREALKENGVRIAHCSLFLGSVYGRWAAFKEGLPVIIGTENNSFFNKGFVEIALDRMLAKHTDRLVCVADAVRDTIVENEGLPAGKFVVIRNGIDVDQFSRRDLRDVVRRELGIDAGAPVLGVVSRLWPWKRVDWLVRAAAALRNDVPGLQLLVIGDGPELPALEALSASLRAQDCVRFMKTQEDTARLYPVMDVYVHPSVEEGFPGCIYEAMCAGLPVVCNDFHAAREVVDHGVNGYVFNFESQAEDTRAAIRRLLTTAAEREALGARGAALIRERYHERRMVDEYEALYLRLLSENEHLDPAALARKRRGGD